MNYAPEFAPDGKADWRELEPELKELVLDEMERLARNLPLAPVEFFLADFVHESADANHYVWLRRVVNRTTMKLTVVGVKHYARAKGR